MSKSQELLEFYKSVLKSLKIESDADGFLSTTILSGDAVISVPFNVDGKRVVLPTDEILRANAWDNLVAFHPLSENILRGESEIFKAIKGIARFNAAYRLATIVQTLMEIASDKERQAKLTAKQGSFLTLVADANEKTLTCVIRLIEKNIDDFINIYMKRDGVLDGETYRRLAVVTFPILEEMKKEGTRIYNVETGSKKNKKTIQALFEYVLGSETEWSFGSNYDVAPYFHALLGWYNNYSVHLNSLVTKYRKHFDKEAVDYLLVDTSLEWLTQEHFTNWKQAIPALDGNIGAPKAGETTQPVAATASVSDSLKDRLDRLSNTQTRQPQVQSALQNLPTVPAPAQPQQNNRLPMAPAQQPRLPVAPPQPPADGKRDWRSAIGGATPMHSYGVQQPMMQQPMQYGYQPLRNSLGI